MISDVPSAAKQLAEHRALPPSTDCPVPARIELLDLHSRFPQDPSVDGPLLAVLQSCRDWTGIADLLEKRADGPNAVDPFTLGKIHIKAKSFHRAIELLAPAAAADPRNPEIAWALGLALFDAGRRQEASPYLDAVADVRAAEGHADALVLQGLVAMYRGDPDAALAALTRASNLEPKNVAAWNALGRAQARVGDQPEAKAAFDEADRLNALQTRAEAEAIRLGGLVASLRTAYADQRHGDAEQLIDELLPLATPTLTTSLYEMRSAILTARGDAAGAATAAEQAAEWKVGAGEKTP
jgi:tetratricopeptide (TPR) repeat protein